MSRHQFDYDAIVYRKTLSGPLHNITADKTTIDRGNEFFLVQ
jgi:hypothetical protein